MTEQSSNTPSRKIASRLMLGAAVLALPLTASITYAETLVPEIPGPIAAPLPPAPPAAPKVDGMAVPPAPEAPFAPKAPAAPEPGQSETTIITIDPDTGETKTVTKNGQFNVEADEIKVVKVKDKKFVVMSNFEEGQHDGAKTRTETVRIVNSDGELSEAEMEEIMVEVREGLAEADKALTEVRVQLTELEKSEMWEELAELQGNVEGRTVVKMSCDNSSDEVATTTQLEDGRTEVVICQSKVMSYALKGIEQAREAIANNPEITGEMRSSILKELDQQIERWKKEAR